MRMGLSSTRTWRFSIFSMVVDPGFLVPWAPEFGFVSCVGWVEQSETHRSRFGYFCCAVAQLFLMSVLGPTAEILFFARPKKSSQKKSRPTVARAPCAPRFRRWSSEAHRHHAGRESSLTRPFGPFPPKTPVLGAAERDFKIKSQKQNLRRLG